VTLLVVEGDYAVGEDEGGIGGVGAVGGGAVALGLELVTEVADEAAAEVEGELGAERAQSRQLTIEVVEDRFSLQLNLAAPLDSDLSPLEVIGDDCAKRALAIAHEGEAPTFARGAAVEPESAAALSI
jgi:hypothetical protein